MLSHRERPLHGSMAAVPGPRHKKPAVAFRHRDNQKDKMPLCTLPRNYCPAHSDSVFQTQVLTHWPNAPRLQKISKTMCRLSYGTPQILIPSHTCRAGLWEVPWPFPACVWWIQLRSRCCVNGDTQLPKQTGVLGERGAGLSRSRCRTWEFLAGWLASGGFPK